MHPNVRKPGPPRPTKPYHDRFKHGSNIEDKLNAAEKRGEITNLWWKLSPGGGFDPTPETIKDRAAIIRKENDKILALKESPISHFEEPFPADYENDGEE